jgi:SAM-dependent methyltransferase
MMEARSSLTPDGELTVVKQQRLFAPAAALALLVGLASPAEGKTRADCEQEYTPQRGQEGKDVVWAPTEDAMVVRMLEMANVTPADKVYDLGAGDGKIAIAAAKLFGATAVGVEYDPDLARHAQCLVEAEGVEERVKVVQGDIFETDFRDATVVTLYLLPDLNLRLRPTLLDMKPGTRVVSYSFTMRDWEPDALADTDEGSAYLWIVPAKVDGAWTFRPRSDQESFDVALDQTFQKLKGSAGGAPVTGKLSGPRIEFAFMQGNQETRVTGIVDGNRISGSVARDGTSTDYIAIRK